MAMFQKLADYTLGEADMVRRAMVRKSAKNWTSIRAIF